MSSDRVRERPARAAWWALLWAPTGAVLVLVAAAAVNGLFPGPRAVSDTLGPLAGVIAAVLAYLLVMRVAGGPDPLRVPGRRALTDVGLGVAIAVVLSGVGTLLLVATGGLDFTWAPGATVTVLSAVCSAAIAAVAEELAFRGVLQQGLTRLVGPWVAVPVTAVCFGMLHALGEGVTVLTGVTVSLGAGLLLSALAVWRGSLWCGIGVHFGWNLLLDLLGTDGGTDAVTSGALIRTERHFDSPFLQFAALRIDGEIPGFVVVLTAAVLVLVLAWRTGRLPGRASG